jgi:hypothetical protein
MKETKIGYGSDTYSLCWVPRLDIKLSMSISIETCCAPFGDSGIERFHGTNGTAGAVKSGRAYAKSSR